MTNQVASDPLAIDVRNAAADCCGASMQYREARGTGWHPLICA